LPVGLHEGNDKSVYGVIVIVSFFLLFLPRNVVKRCYENVYPSVCQSVTRFKILKYFSHLMIERCFYTVSQKSFYLLNSL